MRIKTSRMVANKWLKTKTLVSNQAMAKHIPKTRLYNQVHLQNMIHVFGRVVLKPVEGTGGNGVIFIRKERQNYIVRYMNQEKKCKNLETAISCVKKIQGIKKYLIQQGIDLLKVNGRPIDFRIRLEKPHDNWVITRSIGRVARKGLWVTNLCKGGAELTLEEGLKKALGKNNVTKESQAMIKLAELGTRLMEKKFPGVRRLGFDFGVDHKGRIWIFEVNTKPA